MALHVLRLEAAAGRGRRSPAPRSTTSASADPTALTVFASDAISSTAYATEEILLVLVPGRRHGGAQHPGARSRSWWRSCWPSSSPATARPSTPTRAAAAPTWSAARTSAPMPSLVAGASLLVDYILTVAVSISAGVAAVTSAFAGCAPTASRSASARCWSMMLVNLRGTKESGKVFAPPVYTYVVSLALLIGFGLFEVFVRGLAADAGERGGAARASPSTPGPAGNPIFTGITVLLLLRAFSSGAVALTGVEAISNGVPAFKKPESHNAATTLMAMGAILGVAFIGLSVLAHNLQPTVSENETLLSTMARYLYRGRPQQPRQHRRRPVLRAPVLHLRHPDPGGQHRLRRLPPGVVDHRRRRLPAPPAQQPGRPPRVLQRHPGAGRRGRPAHRRPSAASPAP